MNECKHCNGKGFHGCAPDDPMAGMFPPTTCLLCEGTGSIDFEWNVSITQKGQQGRYGDTILAGILTTDLPSDKARSTWLRVFDVPENPKWYEMALKDWTPLGGNGYRFEAVRPYLD